VACLCQQHTRHCDWEEFDSREEFLDEVRRKGAQLDKRMVYEKKKKIREKYLKEPPGWILGFVSGHTQHLLPYVVDIKEMVSFAHRSQL
jgi:hypothetical protein